MDHLCDVDRFPEGTIAIRKAEEFLNKIIVAKNLGLPTPEHLNMHADYSVVISMQSPLVVRIYIYVNEYWKRTFNVDVHEFESGGDYVDAYGL